MCDAATTLTAIGYAAITLPGSPRLIGIAHETLEELPAGSNVRDWLRAQSRQDGVVIDTRRANELAFVHMDVLIKVPYELQNGLVWVDLEHAVVDGPGGDDPQLLYALGASLERLGVRLSRGRSSIKSIDLFPADGAWS